MPQFAKRLAHPTGRPAAAPNPALERQKSLIRPPQGGPIYHNGPINGNVDAWDINFGSVVSDTFSVGAGAGSVTGMSFGAWLYPGDTLNQAELSITSEPNGGTTYFDQSVSFSQTGCTANPLGYYVCTETATFNGPNLNAGTYWVNLQNASVPSGDVVYWDENSGVGCQSPGCPSQASNNEVGTIPSESFTMLGSNGSPICFGTEGNLQVLFNFTQQQAGTNGPAGITIDRAGNLYGTSNSGGNNSAGFAYKLAHHLGWLLDPLFSFLGGNTGGEPTGAIIGPNGSLYGGAQGGIQNCGSGGSQYCGLVFNVTPSPTACKTSLCYWNENVPYRFTSDADGSGVINVSAYDQQGNLYGTTSTGGANGVGTVFELTPSGGSWTKTTLYSFTGANDGTTPTQVLAGNDGNLYGIAGGGMFSEGVVFQLTSSGGQWTQSVIHAFGSEGDSSPAYLVQDGAGNLYGIAENISDLSGVIFAVLKTGSGWGFNQYLVKHNEFDGLNNLTIDTAGNLYGTGYDGSMFRGSRNKSPGEGDSHDSYIFKASYANGSWNYEDLEYLSNQSLDSSGSLALDTSGNLYGTTDDCGTYNSGTVWQLSP